MTNTTETYWSVDGVSLQTFAQNITSWGGDRETPPRFRGGDEMIPFMPGERWLPKVVDARTMSLAMWVLGANPNGTAPQSGNAVQLYRENWRALRKLLWTPRRQITLTKRFRLAGETVVREASARAQFLTGLEPLMTGGSRATTTVDLRLADPYFYSELSTPTKTLNRGTTSNLAVEGDDRTSDLEIVFRGNLVNPKLKATMEDGTTVEFIYGDTITANYAATILPKQFKATQTFSTGTRTQTHKIRNNTDAFWFYLDPGTVSLTFSADSGTGVAEIRYRAAWF